MTADYRVKLRIGSRAWDYDTAALADYVFQPSDLVPGIILAPLSVGWRFPDSTLWPCQPEPTTLRFSMVYQRADQVPFDLGSTVHCQVFLGLHVVGEPASILESVRFAGRVSDLDAYPIKLFGQVCWRVDLVCTDYTADLAQYDVAGTDGRQSISTVDRINGLFDVVGLGRIAWHPLTGTFTDLQLTLNGGVIESQTLAAAVDKFLRTHADGGPYSGSEDVRENHVLYPIEGWRRGVVRGNLLADGNPDPAAPFRVEWVSRRYRTIFATTQQPLRWYRPTGGLYRIDVAQGAPVRLPGAPPVDDFSVRVPADFVEFASAKWARRRSSDPVRVVVSNNDPGQPTPPNWRTRTATVQGGDVSSGITARVDDSLSIFAHSAQFAAEMYLPDVADPPYKADTFVYHASRDPKFPHVPSWFPDTPLWGGHSQPILVHGLPEHITPGSRRGWYAGVLQSVEYTIAGGEYEFAFSLRPGAPRPSGASNQPTLRFNQLTQNHLGIGTQLPTPRFNNIDPVRNRFSDFRLVRDLSDHAAWSQV